MRVAHLFAISLLLGIAPLGVGQESQTGILDRDKVNAGEKFHLKVELSEAPTYSSLAFAWMAYKTVNGLPSPKEPVSINCNGTTKPGDRELAMECSVPFDADGGTYGVVEKMRINPPPGGSRFRFLPLQVPDIQVVPVPDKNVYPGAATATISLDQKQILRNAGGNVEDLLDQLNSNVDERSAETKEFRAYLSNVASTARGELEKTRRQYRETLLGEKKEPIFFEDFDRQLENFMIEAKSPKIGTRDASLAGHARLLRVQLTNNDSVTVHPTPLDGALGPYLSALVQILTNLRDAYQMIADTGSDTFTISLKSNPPGATVSYRRIGEQYQEYSSATNIDKATFPYAMWTFRFTIGHCEVVKHPNPYIEKSPNLDVQMQDCRKK